MLSDPLVKACEALGVTNESIKGVEILLLPENIDEASSPDELFDTRDSIAFAKFLKGEGVNFKTAFDLGAKPKVKDRRSIDIWLGVIWVLEKVGAPIFVNRFNEFLKKKSGDTLKTDPPRVHVDLRLQDGDRISTLQFDGSATDFLDVIAGLRNRQDRIE